MTTGTTEDERTMAMFAQLLQVVGGWIAPLIIFLVKRQSRFVSFHALQALLLQIVHLFCVFVFLAIGLAMFAGVIFQQVATRNATPPVGVFFLFPLVWLGFVGMWVTILITGIVYGIKANHGEWAEYPVLGKIARNILKIGPGGTDLPPVVA